MLYLLRLLFIRLTDPVYLLSQNEFPVISALQYQDTVIPCKPTMPNIEVLLTTSHGEVSKYLRTCYMYFD